MSRFLLSGFTKQFGLAVFGFFLFFGSVAPLNVNARIDCWCKNASNECEHFTVNSPGDTELQCGSSENGKIGCSTYCDSRNAAYNQVGWKVLHCDSGGYIPRAKVPVVVNGKEECPDTRQKADTQPTIKKDPKQGSSTLLDDPLNGVTIEGFIGRLVKAIIGICGAVALLLFVYGGFLYMTGTDDSIKQAKAIMKNAVLGLVLIFFSYMIISILFSFFSRVGA